MNPRSSFRRSFSLGIWSLVCVTGWTVQPLGDESKILTPGHIWERPLHAHQVHEYEFDGAAGHLVHFRFFQRGIDIVLEIWAIEPARLLLTVDTRNRTDGPEEVWWIPEERGRYRLKVRPFSRAPLGKYGLEVFEHRIATSQDLSRVQAIWKLHQSRQEDDLVSGIQADSELARLKEAIKLWKAAGEAYQEGVAWFQWADVAKGSGKYQDAVAGYKHALGLFVQLEEATLEIDVLFAMGEALRVLSDHQTARKIQESARQLARHVGDRRREATALNNIGVLHQNQGGFRQALESFGAALEIYSQLRLRSERAAVLLGLGQTYNFLGRQSDGMEYLEAAFRLAKSTGNERTEALSLSGMGWVLAVEERSGEALEHYKLALEIHRRHKAAYPEAGVLHQMGRLSQKRGDPNAALRNLSKALEIFQKLEASRDQAHVLLSLADLFLEEGQTSESIEASTRALARLKRSGDRDGVLYAHYLLGRAADGDPELARREFKTAFEMVEEARRGLANHTLSLPFYDVRRLIEVAYRRSLLRLDAAYPGQGYREQAFEIGERVRGRGLVEMLAARTDNSLPAELESLGKQLDKLAWKSLDLTGRAAPRYAPTEELREMISRFADQMAAFLRTTGTSSPSEDLEITSLEKIQKELLDSDTLMLIYALGQDEGELWVISKDEVDLHQIAGRREISGWVEELSNSLFRGFRREKEIAIEALLQKLSDLLLGPVQGYLEDARRVVVVADGELHSVPFSALPIPGHTDSMIEHHEIVRLPSASVLARLRARTASRTPAIRSLAVIADPVFSRCDERFINRQTTSGVSTAVGCTAHKPDDEKSSPRRSLEFQRQRETIGLDQLKRLPGTLFEAEEIVKLRAAHNESVSRLPMGGVLEAYGFAARRDLVTSGQLADFEVLHFATHAFVHHRHPELSGLVLSLIDEEGGRNDGFLRSHEISRLELTAELVVLSACETAVGELHAEGPSSLARSFLNAGATRVLVSLWKVDDRATAVLMRHFYRALWQEGESPAAALRLAQLALLRQERFRAPYYWAGFELQGDWRRMLNKI